MNSHRFKVMLLALLLLLSLLFAACGNTAPVSGELISDEVSDAPEKSELVLPDLSNAGCVTVTARRFVFCEGDTVRIKNADILAGLIEAMSETGFEVSEKELLVPNDEFQSGTTVLFYRSETPTADEKAFCTLWIEKPKHSCSYVYIQTDKIYRSSTGTKELKAAVAAVVSHYCGFPAENLSLSENNGASPFEPREVTLPIPRMADRAELEAVLGACNTPNDTAGLYAVQFRDAVVGVAGVREDKFIINSLWGDTNDSVPQIRGISIGDSAQEVLERFPIEAGNSGISAPPENGSLMLYGDLEVMGSAIGHLYFKDGLAVYASYSLKGEVVRFDFDADARVRSIFWAEV